MLDPLLSVHDQGVSLLEASTQAGTTWTRADEQGPAQSPQKAPGRANRAARMSTPFPIAREAAVTATTGIDCGESRQMRRRLLKSSLRADERGWARVSDRRVPIVGLTIRLNQEPKYRVYVHKETGLLNLS